MGMQSSPGILFESIYIHQQLQLFCLYIHVEALIISSLYVANTVSLEFHADCNAGVTEVIETVALYCSR